MKTLAVKDGERVNIDQFPNFDRSGNITGMKNLYYGLDALLDAHGYRRDGRLYRAHRPNHGAVALFCHFGVGCVLLAHLLSLSPMVRCGKYIYNVTSEPSIYHDLAH